MTTDLTHHAPPFPRPTDERRTNITTFYLTDTEKLRLRDTARKQHRTVSALIRVYILRGLDNEA